VRIESSRARPSLPIKSWTTARLTLGDLDAALAVDQDDEVGNLIWVSFVENAQGVPGDMEEPLRTRLRGFPHLAEALSHYE
jgi:hypothetical protein